MSHWLYLQALKETFEVVCKGIARSSSAELLASFCDSIVKKSRSCEELSDEAIEEILEKVNLAFILSIYLVYHLTTSEVVSFFSPSL